MQFRTNSKKVSKRFASQNIEVNIIEEKVDQSFIRYIMVNASQEEKPLLVFVHGAPGSSDNYYQFMEDPELYSHLRMISIDRPGYGYSNFGKSMTSIEQQAGILNSIIKKHHNHQQVILVGHSFGGPIVAKAALLEPQNIHSVIMLAPAIDPEHEKIFKIAYLGYKAPFRWITPKSWKVAADEKFTHIEELKKMLPEWSHLKTPIIHIHGDKDRLVPYENLAFSKKMIDPSFLQVIGLEGEDHFLPWSQKALIKQTVLQQLNRKESSASR